MCVHDSGGAEVLTVGPEDRAGRGTCCTEDALGGVIETCTVLNGLQALTLRLVRVVDEERHDFAVCLEEGLHVNDEVLFAGQTLDGLNGNRLGQVKVLQQGLASQAVTAVNAHCVRATDAVCTGAAEGDGAVYFPLDLVQGIEHAVGAVHGQREFVPVGLGGNFRVVAANLDDHIVRGDGIGVAAGHTLKQLDGFRFGEFVFSHFSTYAPSARSGCRQRAWFRIAGP